LYPILLHIGSYSVHSFGVLLMLAFAAAVWRASKSAERAKAAAADDTTVPDSVDILDVSVWLILAGVLGARALFVALDWADYKDHPGTWLAIWEGGISFHGALIGGLAALIVFTVRRKLSFLKLVDICVPSVMLGYAIGRIGCFLNGCCYGIPTSMPWGVRFYEDGHWTVPSHPTQIYASIMAFVFFGMLVWLEHRKTFDGQILGWYLIFAAVERFVMEIWRGNVTSTVVRFGLTDVQFLCIGIFIAGIITLLVLRRRKSAGAPAEPALGAVSN